jgi:RNA-splicing ligase RtcB
MFEIKGKYTTAKVMIDAVEETCVKQIHGFLNHPAFTNPISIMPDTHAGKGSVIGFTMPLTSKVIPNVIGVDIGCGMLSYNLGTELNISLEQLDKQIREKVPFGFSTHDKAVMHFKNEFPWTKVRESAKQFTNAYNKKFNTNFISELYEGEDKWFQKKCEQIGADQRRVINSIGTLGGGNHFVEIGKSADDHFWLTIHTGSRNFGKCVCEYWQNYAIKVVKKEKDEIVSNEIKRIRETFVKSNIEQEIKVLRQHYSLDNISQQLCYLEGESVIRYLFDMIFAQQYAQVNREHIAKIISNLINPAMKAFQQVESVHNFIDFRDFIIRKGAIRSYTDELMIIPFNMRDGILLCKGKSNSEWNYSAPHGAGRVLSRSAAKREVKLEDFEKSMQGIFSTSIGLGTLDESPMAYKDSKMIEEAIEPTAEIIAKIKPILNMKDSEGKEKD